MSPTARQMDLLRYVVGFEEVHGRYPSDAVLIDQFGEHRRALARLLGSLAAKTSYVGRTKAGKFAIRVKPAIPRDPDGAPLYFVRLP